MLHVSVFVFLLALALLPSAAQAQGNATVAPRIEGVREDVRVMADTIRLAGVDTQVFRMDDGPSQSTGTVLDAMKGRGFTALYQNLLETQVATVGLRYRF